MIRHDPFLELAAVAIDFELSPAERTTLEAHLATCPACLRSAGALAADARALAALPVTRLSERRADAIMGSLLRPVPAIRPTLRLLALAALLAVLAVGSILVGAELLRQRDDPLVVVPPPSASVDPDASPVVPAGTWAKAGGLSDTSYTVDPPSVVGFDDGYLAIIPRLTWFSPDGATWAAIDLPGPDLASAAAAGIDLGSSSGGTSRAVATDGKRVVVVGLYGHAPCTTKDVGGGLPCVSSPISWVSDDGVTWRSSFPWVGPASRPSDGFDQGSGFSAVWAVPGGWEAALYFVQGEFEGQREVWFSADGITWEQRATVYDPGVDRERVAMVAADGARVLSSHYQVGDGQGGSGPVRLWSSTDGHTWIDLAAPEGARIVGGGVGPSGSRTSWLLAGCGSGADAIGGCRPVLWTLEDGGAWGEIRLPGMEAFQDDMATLGFEQADSVVARVGFGFVDAAWAYGGAEGVQATWLSLDGATWRAVEGAPLVRTVTDGPAGIIGIGVPDDAGVTPVYVLRLETAAPSAEPAQDAARIRCETDGTTTVETPVVRVQADGVHIVTVNETGAERALAVDTVGGDNAGPGTSETVWAVPPGVVRVACYDSTAGPAPDKPFVELTVVDPDGTYVPTDLDCTDATVGSGSYPAGAPGWVGDPVDLTRLLLAGSHPEYAVEAAGYLMNDIRQVRVVDGDRAVARLAWAKAGTDRWLLDTVTTCGGIDLGLEFGALDGMILGPSPSPAATPSLGADLAWEQAPDQTTLADAGMTAVAVGADAYVAVGCATDTEFDATECAGAAWYSVDGWTWERAAVPSADSLYLDGVIASPIGYLAWAYDVGASPGAAFWVSPDGRKWQRAPTISSFAFNHVFEVVWFQDRFVAHSDWNDKRIWTSGDGLAWLDQSGCESPSGPAAPEPLGDSVHLVIVGDELLRVGTAFMPADENVYRGAQDYLRVISRSTDGICSLSTTASDGWIFDIAVTADGLVGVGRQHDLVGSGAGSPPPPMAAWTSVDGSSWTPASFPGEPPNGDLSLVAAGDRGVLALGSLESGDLSAWRSEDGTAWTRKDPPPVAGELSGLAPIPGGFIGVGRQTDATGHPTAIVWIAR